MAVQRFHSISETGNTCRHQPGTAEFSRSLRAVFWLAALLAPSGKIPPGVYKFRSIEESQARKQAWSSGKTMGN
jgi:hypothetical protein